MTLHWDITLSTLSNIIVTLILMVNVLSAQINVKVGYVGSFPILTTNDQLLSDFDPEGGVVSEDFGSTGFMQGLQLGLRYRLSNVALEMGWESVSQDRSALIFNNISDSFSDRQYSYGLSAWRAGVDNYFGKFGLSSALMYQQLKIDRIIGSNDLTVIKERQLAIRLAFIWQVQKSSLISFEIRPFYQFSLRDYDLSGLANDLDLDASVDVLESPILWGISLIFNNGRQ